MKYQRDVVHEAQMRSEGEHHGVFHLLGIRKSSVWRGTQKVTPVAEGQTLRGITCKACVCMCVCVH